jgi:AcrR family transcriptional regulator
MMVQMSETTPDLAPAQRPLRRDAELNRQRILKAARSAFADGGLSVTLDEIARCAGVGVGTVYRRFPDKEVLIDALFEERIGEVAEVAEEALTHEDPWQGLVAFLERATEMHAHDRGLKEVLLEGTHGRERVARGRARMVPLVTRLVERAQADGSLRADVRATDMPAIQIMLASLGESTRDVAPDIWRRYLAIVCDGLRTRRDGTTPLQSPALAPVEVEGAMRAWRPAR